MIDATSLLEMISSVDFSDPEFVEQLHIRIDAYEAEFKDREHRMRMKKSDYNVVYTL